MKIVYIANAIIPSRTAYSVHVMKMCQAFATNKHELILLTPDRKREYENNSNVYEFYNVENCFKIKKFFYPYVKGKSFLCGFAVIKEIRKIKPDLVYGRFLEECSLVSRLGYNTIYESHTPPSQHSRLEKFFFNLLIRCKDFVKIVVISHALKELYVRFSILDKDRIIVAHDGADEEKSFLKIDNWIGRKNVLQVGYFGHLYPGRGIDIIVDIAKRLPGCDFHIVGGFEKDIKYWKFKNLSNNIYFHGFIPHIQLYKYRNSCDVLLAPYQKKVSIYGGNDTSKYMSPLKIFEYMSCRKPIISSDLPVLREVLNKTNSILVSPDDINGWVDAIEKMKESTFREKIATKAYTDFVENYTWTLRAKKILNEVRV